MHPREMVQRVLAVTPEDVKTVANRYIKDRDFALSALGPLFEMGVTDYNYIRRRTYWLVE